MKSSAPSIPISITPWITVLDGERALSFCREAFGAEVVYRLEDPHAGVVARLSVNGAQSWISDGAQTGQEPECAGGGTVRMILSVPDPEAVFCSGNPRGSRRNLSGRRTTWLANRPPRRSIRAALGNRVHDSRVTCRVRRHGNPLTTAR